jgi:molybdopterin converting factor subunit 1
MQVAVLFFGHYRDIIRDGKRVLDLPGDATVSDAANHLMGEDARLTDLMTKTRIAVNSEFAGFDTVLQEGDELAFLPPMSGG